MSSQVPRAIALVGLMGAGKSSVARWLSSRLGLPLADLDARVEAGAGVPIAELFAQGGEAAFRARESRELERAASEGAGVIDCGGGAVLDARSRETLRTRCRMVWLEVSPEVAARRVGDDVARPMLAGAAARDRLQALLEARRPLYEEVAAFRVATDERTPAEVGEAVLRALGTPAE